MTDGYKIVLMSNVEDIDDSSFEIKVENANIFEGDKDGTKLNYNGEEDLLLLKKIVMQ